MKTKVLFIMFVIMLIMVACGTPTQKTDNGLTVTAEVDSQVYRVDLLVENFDQYSTINAYSSGSMYNGYGSFSGSVWEDGKGLVRGLVLDVSPKPDWYVEIEGKAVNANLIYIIKTTDRKSTMGVPGDILHMICLSDYEPVCSEAQTTNAEGEVVSVADCIATWEFDFCRLEYLEHPVATPQPTDDWSEWGN